MSAGELGAVDPCRLAVTHKRILDDVMPGVATARPQRDEHAANPFSCDLSDTELCSNIIERFLIRTLQGAGEGPAVQATAYALMMLLQDVCHCDEGTPALLPTWWAHRKVLQSGQGDDRAWKALSTEQKTALKLWAGLAEPTRHAVKPYLRLSAELGAGEAAGATEPEPSPVFRPGCSYSGWLTRWVQQLLQHADAALRPRTDGRAARPEQKSRAWLLLACRPCLRHDLGLAKCLLPYLLQLLLGLEQTTLLAQACAWHVHGVCMACAWAWACACAWAWACICMGSVVRGLCLARGIAHSTLTHALSATRAVAARARCRAGRRRRRRHRRRGEW